MSFLCLNFGSYPDQTSFGTTFSLGLLSFTALGTRPPMVKFDEISGRLCLEFDNDGIRIDFPVPVVAPVLHVISPTYNNPVIVSAIDVQIGGEKVLQTITLADGKQDVQTITLSAGGQGIDAVILTGGGGEGQICEICVPESIVYKAVDDALDPGKIEDEKIKDILNDPEAKDTIKEIKDEFIKEYLRKREEEEDDDDGGGGGLGKWDPEVMCILGVLAAIVAARVLLSELLVLTPAAPYITGPYEVAINSIMSVMTVGRSMAVFIYWLATGLSPIEVARKYCEDKFAEEPNEGKSISETGISNATSG